MNIMRRNYAIKHNHGDDRTCGQSIQSFEIDSTRISFFDSNKNPITEIPKLPKYSGNKYHNRLYKKAESRQFDDSPADISSVLPNSFDFKYGYISYIVKHDDLSQQEQDQIKIDIETAYRAFKEKFCLKDNNADKDITVYIFNNRNDYVKYNDLLNLNYDGKTVDNIQYITRGVTDSHEKILTYKQNSMDFVLAHELGHILQWNFSPAEKVRNLHYEDSEFIANFIGREVEEENHKFITTGYRSIEKEDGFFSHFIFSAIEFIVGSISSLFSWIFGYNEEKSDQQFEKNLYSLELNVEDNIVENCTNNCYSLDDYNHYHSPDALL